MYHIEHGLTERYLSATLMFSFWLLLKVTNTETRLTLNVAFCFFPIRQNHRFQLGFVFKFPPFLSVHTQIHAPFFFSLLIVKIPGLLSVFSYVFPLHERCHGCYITRDWDEWVKIWTSNTCGMCLIWWVANRRVKHSFKWYQWKNLF